ncbi:MAG TPA: S8 family serine peptidase, partial [Thermoanaerobaculia bacterium]|nr:S8 family serine peptidase [Thermoanaerobaculia bacterium]
MKIHRILSYILLVTGLSASAATKVSPEVAARFARGDAQVRVLVALEPAESLAPGAEPHAAAEVRARALTASLPPGSFSLRRTYENASVVAGSLTAVGLAALEKRSDVRGVSLDGIVHTVGQAATAHIGADRLASIGVTGFGRSIAIVDTGIDARHPDLGGSGAMNPRLLGGFSFAEMSNDLSDCDGHGTEVAGVVGGPNGIAPDVSFVALKVFKAADGCRSANFSDVLAAVDWAVAKRAEMKIDTVNLSLADEAIRIGFCDSEDPASASLFRAARDAGIAVVAASGNDGKTDGLAWPACFSDVAAVGMVYSVSSGATNWGGSAACRDAISAPDVVPCASNSGTALSLLAPGVNWVTTSVGGGQTSSFSGTSAAAPAAAGAILLTRQARSLGDPVLAFDLLRATGTPVADDKNGITTPRVDVSAAFDATAPITGPCSSMTIPDGSSGGVACEAEVSAIVGRVSTISVALSIEHPDSRQLVATLIGPDGTSALILRGSGRAAHAFREVLGRTVPSAEPLSIFAGHEAAGTWRLVIADETPGASGRIVSWALLVEPVLPAVGTAPFTKNAVIPTTAHRTGRFGSFFTSDVRLFNSDPANAQTVTLRYMAAAREANDPGRQVSVSIPPFGTRVLTDVLGNAFRTDDYGAVFVDAPAGVVSGSRTQSTAVRGGTYGLFVPSLPTAASLGAGPSIQLLVPPFLSTGFRVNVGFTETAGSPATVELSVKDKRGAPKGSVTRTVPPF